MSVSKITNDSSDKSKAIWLPCPGNGEWVPNLFENLSIPASTPLVVGSTSSNTTITFEDPDNSSLSQKTVVIENSGDAINVVLPKNCSKVWAYVGSNGGEATVSVAIREDAATPTVKSASLLTYTSTNNSPGLTGKGFVFIVGGGGGSVAYPKFINSSNVYGNQMTAVAGGGGSGGMNSAYIEDLSTITSIAVGGGGTYGYNAGNTGGTSSVVTNSGTISSTGGGGGRFNVSNLNVSVNLTNEVAAGAGGSPNGADGAPGLVITRNSSSVAMGIPQYSTFPKPDWFPHIISSGSSGPIIGNAGTNFNFANDYNSVINQYNRSNLGSTSQPSAGTLSGYQYLTGSSGYGVGSGTGTAFGNTNYQFGGGSARNGVVYILRWTE
jgi:hypothetical protein